MFPKTLVQGAVALTLIAGTLSTHGLAQGCSQKHFKGSERLARSIKSGDVKILRGIAGHTVRNALEYYGIEDLVSEAEITNAAHGMEYFLKWKLGSPTLVTGQWVTAGYSHFEKSYRDEAAGMLLGVFELSETEPELKLPEFMLDWIEIQVGRTDEAIAGFLVSEGIPMLIAGPLAKKAEEALQGLLERNRAGVFVPKSFDIKNAIVETAIEARRATPPSNPFGGLDKGGNGDDGGDLPPILGGPFPSWLPKGPVGGAPSNGGSIEGRLADLETRVQRLEQLLGAACVLLENGEQEGVALRDVPNGYELVKMSLWTANQGRCLVSVNGVLVGMYDTDATLDLTPFLQPGKTNEVSFEFEIVKNGNPSSLSVWVTGTMPGSNPVRFYQFQSSKERAADAIEIAVAPRS